MNSSHKSIAGDLQIKAQSRGWLATIAANNITLSKCITQKIRGYSKEKVIQVTLERTNTGNYNILQFNSDFHSHSSYFDYSAPETRWIRNKVFFTQLFNLLKDCDIWDLISNKETYIQVNPHHYKLQGKSKESKFIANAIEAQLKKLQLEAKQNPRKYEKVKVA